MTVTQGVLVVIVGLALMSFGTLIGIEYTDWKVEQTLAEQKTQDSTATRLSDLDWQILRTQIQNQSAFIMRVLENSTDKQDIAIRNQLARCRGYWDVRDQYHEDVNRLREEWWRIMMRFNFDIDTLDNEP